MLTVLTVREAQRRIINSLKGKLTEIETISVEKSLGRAVAKDVIAPYMLPPFARSTMDGFAVRAADTFGASDSIPALLKLKGNILMGQEPPGSLEPGEAMEIPTGGMIPAGGDSVVMLEHCEIIGDQVAVYRPAAPFDNTIQVGDDFKKGELVIPSGRSIRSQDIGILSSMGVLQLKVYSRPRVVIFSTGDEIIPPWMEPKPGQIRDINGSALAALTEESGGIPDYRGIIKDDKITLHQAVLEALDEADIVLISGGSSVGTRDVAVKVIDELPGGGVFFHGVSMKPGKPLIYGTSDSIPIFGLSGNPVSALFSFLLFVRPALRVMQGLSPFPPFVPYVEARLDTNLSSPGGREDYIRVSLYEGSNSGKEGDNNIRARPIFGGAGLLSTMVKGDGYFIIPRDTEGLPEGEKVKVYIY
ncbi:MAG TPA: molybdopterin molybdotransferase MoeA [Firmicutes bacterium]|nr:molybdopterin molybdotransferase MoeA [Bacillota bacterium]